jgi:hypothetical protein
MSDMTVNGVSRKFIVIEPHGRLSTVDSTKNPFPKKPGYLIHVAYVEPDMEQVTVVEQCAIISYVALRFWPSRTFGIRRPIVLVHDLSRGRN